MTVYDLNLNFKHALEACLYMLIISVPLKRQFMDLNLNFTYILETHERPHTFNFTGMEAHGHLVNVRGLYLTGFSFDHQSKIYSIEGELLVDFTVSEETFPVFSICSF